MPEYTPAEVGKVLTVTSSGDVIWKAANTTVTDYDTLPILTLDNKNEVVREAGKTVYTAVWIEGDPENPQTNLYKFSFKTTKKASTAEIPYQPTPKFISNITATDGYETAFYENDAKSAEYTSDPQTVLTITSPSLTTTTVVLPNSGHSRPQPVEVNLTETGQYIIKASNASDRFFFEGIKVSSVKDIKEWRPLASEEDIENQIRNIASTLDFVANEAGAMAAVTDYVESLPAVDEENNIQIARLDGKTLHYAEYVDRPANTYYLSPSYEYGTGVLLSNLSCFNTDNLNLTTNEIGDCYSIKYEMPGETYTAVKVGSSISPGRVEFVINSLPELPEGSTIYLVLSSYFSYSTTEPHFNVLPGSARVTTNFDGDINSLVTSLHYVDSQTRPQETLINITNSIAATSRIITLEQVDGSNNFLFVGFKIVDVIQGAKTMSTPMKLMRADLIDKKLMLVNKLKNESN